KAEMLEFLNKSVSGVTVVTQKPPVLTPTKGETTTMHCNLGTVTSSAARWYKQVPGEAPQYVLVNYHGLSSPEYGSGFSSPKFTSTHSSQSDYTLIISNVEVGDSAVYYCSTWDSSSVLYLFFYGEQVWRCAGRGWYSAVPADVLTIFPPSSEELKSNKATLVCLASDMFSAFADVHWLLGGKAVSSGVTTGSAAQQANKKFRLSSYLTIERSEWDKDKAITCEVSAASKATTKEIKKSECSD
uniref:Ig-like domain-containing protein n=1 Tax=Pygocentrus nattereri TaxID=42514 RepID=A0A3B4CFH2_PYGNA